MILYLHYSYFQIRSEECVFALFGTCEMSKIVTNASSEPDPKHVLHIHVP